MHNGFRVAEAGRALPRPPHTEFLGLPFCLLSQQQVVRHIIEQAGTPFRYIVTPNAYHVVMAHDEPARLLPVYRGAWLSLCDSRIVRALAAFNGQVLPLVGSDLVAALLSALDVHGTPSSPQRLLVVGPAASVVTILGAAYPNLAFDVVPAPGNLAHDAEQRLAIARACMDRDWDTLLLCVDSPAQELIAYQLAELGCASGIALCAGTAIDCSTGRRSRAPLSA